MFHILVCFKLELISLQTFKKKSEDVRMTYLISRLRSREMSSDGTIIQADLLYSTVATIQRKLHRDILSGATGFDFWHTILNYSCFNYIFLTCVRLYNVIACSHVQDGVEMQKALDTYNWNANAPA